MRVRVTLAILMAMTSAAFAGGGFEIVIPGRAGVPVIINGVDASYAVVEGDWGLARRIHVQPTIYGGRYIDPVPNVGHYYPSAGHLPGYGRLEVEPPANRRLPQPAACRRLDLHTPVTRDRKSPRLKSSHTKTSHSVVLLPNKQMQ